MANTGLVAFVDSSGSMKRFHFVHLTNSLQFNYGNECDLFSSTNFSVHWIIFVYHPFLTSTKYLHRYAGDRYVKPFLIPKPEVRVIPWAKDDGLWDVISNEDAYRVARRQFLLWHKKNEGMYSGEDGELTVNPATQAAADYLVKLALVKGARTISLSL